MEISGRVREFKIAYRDHMSMVSVQIASVAMAKKLIIVTHNVKEFERIKNLTVEDWAY